MQEQPKSQKTASIFSGKSPKDEATHFFIQMKDPLIRQLDLKATSRLSATCTSLYGLFKYDVLIKKLLHFTVLGRLDQVENILKVHPELALKRATITDLSDRTFYNITGLQYAAWALDIEMCELILKNVDNASASVADTQLSELEKNPWGHGAYYDISPLVKKTQGYLNNYNGWDYDKCCQYWQKEVGGEQRKCPAWLIYAWCEAGYDVAWVKKDLKNIKVVRQYEKEHLKWWFEQAYNGGLGVGSTWSCHRGPRDQVQGWSGYGEMKRNTGRIVGDRECQYVVAQRPEALNSLKARLSNNNATDKRHGQ